MYLSPPSSHDVHLWQTNLNLPSERVDELAKILSVDEKTRAERFRFEQHRNRFIVARGTLRTILGRYLDIEPDRVSFTYSPRGKPTLADNSKLRFNVSHSQDLAIYGFACDRAIGVDIEYLRPMSDADKIARRFFSTRESAILDALPEEEKILAFFRLWTAKEAYLKATGDGLAGSLDRVEVDLLSDELVRFLSIDGCDRAAERWRLHSFVPGDRYIATIAVEGQDWTLRCWQS